MDVVLSSLWDYDELIPYGAWGKDMLFVRAFVPFDVILDIKTLIDVGMDF